MMLADKAEFTMKPFEDTPERGSTDRIFNYRFSRGRRTIENIFGILSSVFRVLRKPLLLDPEICKKIILTTVHLHNFFRNRPKSTQLYAPEGTFDIEETRELIAGRWRNEEAMM